MVNLTCRGCFPSGHSAQGLRSMRALSHDPGRERSYGGSQWVKGQFLGEEERADANPRDIRRAIQWVLCGQCDSLSQGPVPPPQQGQCIQSPLVSEGPPGRQQLLFPAGLKTTASCQDPSICHKPYLAVLWIEKNPFSRLFSPSLMGLT